MSFVIGENDPAPISDKPRTEKKGKSKIPSTSTIVSMMAGVLVFIVLMGSMVIPITVQSVNDRTITIDEEVPYSVSNPNPYPYYLSEGSAGVGRTQEISISGSINFYLDFMSYIEQRRYVTEGWHFTVWYMEYDPHIRALNPDSLATISMVRYVPDSLNPNNLVLEVRTLPNIDENTQIDLLYYFDGTDTRLEITFTRGSSTEQVFNEPARLWVREGYQWNPNEVLYEIPQYSLSQSDSFSLIDDGVLCFPSYFIDDYPLSVDTVVTCTYSEYPLPKNYSYKDNKIYWLNGLYSLQALYKKYNAAQDLNTVIVTAIHKETTIVPFEGSDQVKSLILIIPTVLIAMFVAYLCKAFMGSGGFGRGKGGAE